jgi:hypothetical protein
MKKLVALALAVCFVMNVLPTSVDAADHHKKKPHHKVSTKSHKMKTKAQHKVHIKGMPHTGMGGASN